MPQFIVLPTADVTAGEITTLANALLRPTAALTGLANDTSYTALVMSLSDPFTPMWSPASLFGPGIVGGWYDPSDLSTLFQDSAVPPVTPVTAAGQSVGTMLDKSGNGNHARQTTAASRPTYQTGAGLSWLAHDGVDDFMQTAAINFTGTNKVSVFAGASWVSNGWLVNLNGLLSGSFIVRRLASSLEGVSRGTVQIVAATPLALNTPAVVTLLADIAAPLVSISNGNTKVDVTTSQGTGNYVNSALSIGARDGGSLPMDGRFYGMIVVGKLATASEITNAKAYMTGKTI